MIDIELHAHIDFDRVSIEELVAGIEKQKLDAVAISGFGFPLLPCVKDSFDYKAADKAGLLLNNNCFLLDSGEYMCKEGFHILTVGYSSYLNNSEAREIIDKALQHSALVVIAHPFTSNNSFISCKQLKESNREKLEALCREYSNEICLEWNAHCRPFVRRLLRLALDFNYDVNGDTKILSDELLAAGYNVPVVAATDIHVFRSEHLNYLGTSRIRISQLRAETPAEFLYKMKHRIFSKEYENTTKYVSVRCLFDLFLITIFDPYSFHRKPARKG